MRFLPLLLVFFTLLSFAVDKVLTYGPSIVELTGTLDLQTFPGPPNYESIKDGDKIERHFYLKLEEPINVLPGKENSGIESADVELNVKVIQLSISEEDNKLWSRFRKIGEGGRVTIQGTLFHRFTGHHHSRILMVVNKISINPV